MKISFVRGAYLNNFEGQSYNLKQSKYSITGYSSLYPLDPVVPFPLVRLISLADLQRVPLFTLPIKYLANRTLGDAQILFGLEKQIIGSDIVHVGDPHYYYSYQAAILREKKLVKQLISTWWETIPFNNESTAAKKRIKNYTMSQVDTFLCYSELAKKCLLTEGVDERKIVTIPLGVDLAHFHPTKNKTDKSITILFVGRLVEEKGILDLYDAFALLTKRIKNCNLRIIGNGPLQSVLEKKVETDNLAGRVTIEQKKYEEMPEVYRGADIFCVPSKKTKTWEEQLGMVFIEAMATALPVVSYKTGSIPEVVGEAGEFAETNTLALTLEKLCMSSLQRSKIGTIGRVRTEKLFDARKTALFIEQFYDDHISGNFGKK